MESECFIIIGGDVGATQYRADPRTAQFLTFPLTLGTGADNRVQSLQLDRPNQIHVIHNMISDTEMITIFYIVWNMIPLGYMPCFCVSTHTGQQQHTLYSEYRHVQSLRRNTMTLLVTVEQQTAPHHCKSLQIQTYIYIYHIFPEATMFLRKP